jgi:hypothetical protein
MNYKEQKAYLFFVLYFRKIAYFVLTIDKYVTNSIKLKINLPLLLTN